MSNPQTTNKHDDPPQKRRGHPFWRAGWDEALEEFAQMCEEHPDFENERPTAMRFAAAARKLKDPGL